jgi:hypothetical protein
MFDAVRRKAIHERARDCYVFSMKKNVLIIALLLMITGCGSRLLYPHLDWLIPWYVGDYISLDSEQKNMLEERLARHIDWHCRTKLANYAEFLRSLGKEFADAQQPVDYQRLVGYYTQLRRHWQELIRQIAPDIADILATATDAQIGELYDNLKKQNEKLRSKYVDLPPEKLIEQRAERMVKRLQYWLSQLTTDQKLAIDQWSRQLKPTAADWLQNSQKFQAEIRHLLDLRRTSPAFKQKFVEILVYPEQLRSAEYQRKIDTNTEMTLKFMVAILGTKTPGQQTHLLKQIESLAKDFDHLSCDPKTVGPATP